MPQIIRELFERELAEKLGASHAIAVNSGTSALIGALWSLDLNGAEVITTPFTFVSTTTAIVIAGGKPVFVDVGADSLIDPALIESAITPRSKAIVPVHLFGRVCDMPAITEIAASHNLYVVEDAAQALGATLNGRYAGTWGDCGCFSFYKTKNLSCFEGGMLVVQDETQAKRIRAITDPRFNGPDYNELGFNFRMAEPCCLIGYERVKLHWGQIVSELGRYDESDGYYPRLTYQNGLGLTGDCPVAEALARGIA